MMRTALSALVLVLCALTSAVTGQVPGWVRLDPAMSPPIQLGEMVYDSHRQVVVLVGGEPMVTYTWDGENWSDAAPVTSPPDRSHFGMAFDRTRGRVVLFGVLRLPRRHLDLCLGRFVFVSFVLSVGSGGGHHGL